MNNINKINYVWPRLLNKSMFFMVPKSIFCFYGALEHMEHIEKITKTDRHETYNRKNDDAFSLFDPENWGLPPEALDAIEDGLHDCWERYRECFKTQTRDTSHYAFSYLSGQLRMDRNRNFANIGRRLEVSEQNMQHFMSNSPWRASAVIDQVQTELQQTKAFKSGGFLILDETADEKAGDKNAGAGRQYNGRMGKVDMCIVATFLAYANLTCEVPMWTWIDGELYFQEKWFESDMQGERLRLGIPEDFHFMTKAELGLKMIRKAKSNGLSFEGLCCDGFYGNDKKFRANLRREDILYMADVSRSTPVYLNKPEIGVPECKPGQRGRKAEKKRVISKEKPVQVSSIIKKDDWKLINVRTIERGELEDEFAIRRVWTIHEEQAVEEWLVVRRENGKRCSYSLSNNSSETTIEELAWQKCQRYFVERSNQEAKTDAGWSEFQAQKYRAWRHHTAFCILACFFVAQTKMELSQKYKRNPELSLRIEIDVLPLLSYSNIRELLKAIMPLKVFTREDAISLVVKHFINRVRSRKSRLKRKRLEKGKIDTKH